MKIELAYGVHTGRRLATFRARGATVSAWHYAPGHRAPLHVHDAPFLHALLSGDDSACGFSPVYDEHAVETPEGSRNLHVDLDPGFLDELSDGSIDTRRRIDRHDPRGARIAHELSAEMFDPDSLSAFHVDSLIAELFAIVADPSRTPMSSPPRWLRRAADTIEAHHREALSLERIAADVRVHPVHLSRLFRQTYGETVRDYVRRLRIRGARRMLRAGRHSIAEIAVEVGYYDESHFCKAFARTVGMTPGRYRAIERYGRTHGEAGRQSP